MEQVKIAESAGKTIKACVPKCDNSGLLLLFDDDTYAFLEVQRGYDPGEEEIADGSFNVLNFGEQALVEAGVLDASVAKAMRAEYEAKCDAANRERERQQYERLKRRFET